MLRRTRPPRYRDGKQELNGGHPTVPTAAQSPTCPVGRIIYFSCRQQHIDWRSLG